MDYLASVLNKQLRSEFVRALQTIETTQLTTFRESPVLPRAELLKRFHSLQEAQAASSNEPLEQVQVKIMRSLLREALAAYNDPYANYITPDALNRYYQRRKGNFVGIGVKFRAQKKGYPLVIGALLGGPLESADIRPGDHILSIDGVDQFAALSGDISKRLKGEQDTEVTLELQRFERWTLDQSTESAQSVKVLIVARRTPVKVEYVRSDVLDRNIGYLKVSRFGANSHKTLARQVESLEGRGVKGFVLDLRDNSGGSTRAARAMVSMFSDIQKIYCERLKSGKTRTSPRHGDRLTRLPLVVLINEHSMSSSEIVAGAFQSHQSAPVVGAPSYGKGLIQRVFNLKAPLGGAVRATIAAYATPDHVLIHGVGVTPDYYIGSAPYRIFRETGSLNISANARQFKRWLLEEELTAKYPDQADSLIALKDQQLDTAVNEVKKLI